jgi:3'-phosphoadenosine 5'-phosphosulfate sulfotransferase (PAPS reductase)/FAD synthetase
MDRFNFELKRKKMIVLWFSAGATSAVACKIAIKHFGIDNVRIIYFHIGTAHEDNKRFISECEEWYNKEIEIVKSSKYVDQFDVIEKTKYVNGVAGARCTKELKKDVRLKLEKENNFEAQIFGFEYTKKEIERSKRIPKDINPIFPLIEKKLTKQNCLYILKKAKIELPTMYKLGYPNNNCIGCVKGGSGYWNKIRKDFPDHFNKMAKLEIEIGRSCLKKDGKSLFLYELDPEAGREQKMLMPDCGLFCESELQ